MYAPRTCVTEIYINATTRTEAKKRAAQIVTHKLQALTWNPLESLQSLSIDTRIL